jgi:hypothetical protein
VYRRRANHEDNRQAVLVRTSDGGGVGVPVAELIRKVGTSEQTFYRWESKYVALKVHQIRQLKQLRDENTRLKQLVS